jgi:hypothetical protein
MAARKRKLRQRVQASASARGYGYQHQKLRTALLAQWQPGDPCTRCGGPMWGPPRKIHLGHTDDKQAYRGLEHERCNTADGAARGNRARVTASGERANGQRAMGVLPVRPSRSW